MADMKTCFFGKKTCANSRRQWHVLSVNICLGEKLLVSLQLHIIKTNHTNNKNKMKRFLFLISLFCTCSARDIRNGRR